MKSLIEYIKASKRLRKILIAGSGAVGKTSFVKVLKVGKCLEELDYEHLEYHRTLFCELETLKAEGQQGIFQFLDIAGQLSLPIHAFRDTAKFAFGNVDLVLLLFANDNLQSLLDTKKWINLIKEYYISQGGSEEQQVPPFILVNNKIDLDASAEDALIDQVKKLEEVKAYYEISCLKGTGINTLVKSINNILFNNCSA